MGKKKRLEDIIKSNFSRHIVIPFLFLFAIVAIINFILMQGVIQPRVGAAIQTFTIDGVNITAQIRTLQDIYTINQTVNLTDPPLPGCPNCPDFCTNPETDVIQCIPDAAAVDDTFIAGLNDIGQTCGQTTGADNYQNNNYADVEELYAINIGVRDSNYIEDPRPCGSGGWCEAKNGFNQVLYKINDLTNLPQGETITLTIHTTENIDDINIYEITSDWDESTVNWNNKPSQGDLITTFTKISDTVYQADITDIYSNWKNNPSSNYGLYIYSPTKDTNPSVCWNNYNYAVPPDYYFDKPIYSNFLRIYSSDNINQNLRPILNINRCDEGATRPCGTDVGECTTGIETCTDGRWTDCTGTLPTPEVCTGGLDEDCDGDIDSNDPDCGCVNLINSQIITENTLVCPNNYTLDDGISIGADNIILDCKGAVLQGPGTQNYGIYLSVRNNVTIRNCEITGYNTGIYMAGSSYNNFSYNSIHHNYVRGMDIRTASLYNIIENNEIYSTATREGIYFYSGIQETYNIIRNNQIHSNAREGIFLRGFSSNQIINNEIYSNNIHGIRLYYSGHNTIINNNIFDNNDHGLYLSNQQCRDNNISSNRICNNTVRDIYGCTYCNTPTYNEGYNNICDITIRWDDIGADSGCTYNCSACMDNDGDGYNATGINCGPLDCNDENASIHPNAAEICNLVDDDCDIDIDEALPIACNTAADCGTDGCIEGTYYIFSCNDPGICLSSCSNITNITDIDSDTYDIQCDNDCNDSNASINPGAVEICNNIVDDDCDTNPDTSDPDCMTPPTVDYVYPQDGYISYDNAITFTCNVSDDIELSAVNFYHNINGNFVLNNSIPISGTSYSASWTITDIPDGNYIWACEAVDIGGLTANSGNQSFTVLEKTTPEENQSKIFHDSTSSITINLSLRVEYFNNSDWVIEDAIINNQEQIINPNQEIPLDVLWNPTGWNTNNAIAYGFGPHSFRAVVDITYQGTTQSVIHPFTVDVPDIFNPVITLNSPADEYTTVNTLVSLNWTVEDDSPDLCNLTLDNAVNITDINITDSNPNVYVINFSRGLHSWSIQCIDAEGNSAASPTRDFLITCDINQQLCDDGICRDNCSPINPAGCINQNTICEIGEGCNCSDCNAQQDSCAYGYSCDISTADCEQSIDVNLVSPADNITTAFDDINFTCQAASYYGLSNITLYHNIPGFNNITQTVTGTTNTTIFTLSNISDGTYEWTCQVFDTTGLTDTENIRIITIDTELPTSQILTPTDGIAIDNSSLPYIITGTASSSIPTNIAQVNISINGIHYTAAGTDNWNYTWNPAAEGIYLIRSIAIDSAGRIETDIEDVYVYVSFTSNITNSTAINSTKQNSTVIDSTNINSTVINSTEDSCTLINSNLINSICENSIKSYSSNTNSIKINSTEDNCTLINSTLINSICRDSIKINSIDINSTIIDSTEDNCTVTDSTLIDSECENSIIDNSLKNNSININSTVNNSEEQNCDVINMLISNRVCIDDCGDGICSGSETCSNCQIDCGTCPSNGGGGGGGGGGGCTNNWQCTPWGPCRDGVQNRTCTDLRNCRTERNKPIETQNCTCLEDWICTPWSECEIDGTQTRICEDWNNCGTTLLRPDLEQDCTFIPAVVVVQGTCSDGIRNQDETGIDCGGSCKPCPSCNDGIVNQGEAGIDCGGPCSSPCTEVPKGPSLWFIIFLILIIIILIGGAGFATYYYWPQITRMARTMTTAGIGNPKDLLEVEKYAQKMEDEGYSNQRIIRALRKEGWNQAQIHMVMHNVHKPTGNLINMVEYAKKMRRLGYNDDKIKLTLLKVGWPAVQITKAFEMKALKK